MSAKRSDLRSGSVKKSQVNVTNEEEKQNPSKVEKYTEHARNLKKDELMKKLEKLGFKENMSKMLKEELVQQYVKIKTNVSAFTVSLSVIIEIK
jgi:hypothetical protein